MIEAHQKENDIASVRQYVIQELHFVEAMIYMFQKCRSLSDHIMTCLGTMICADPSFVMPESLLQLLSIAVWKHAQLPIMEKRSFHFYARLILAYASGCAALQSSCDNHPGFAEIDVVRRSKYCLLNYETRLDARNDSWTFETVRCTHSVPGQSDTGRWDATKTHKYAFEVVLVTNGLMQVGWVTDEFEIDPEGGTGVGDDEYSYGYDGCRVKKWHAQRLTRVSEESRLRHDPVIINPRSCTTRDVIMALPGLWVIPSRARLIWMPVRSGIIKTEKIWGSRSQRWIQASHGIR